MTTPQKFILRDKTNTEGFMGMPPRWIYLANRERPTRANARSGYPVQTDGRVMVALTQAEFEQRGHPSELYVTIDTQAPEGLSGA